MSQSRTGFFPTAKEVHDKECDITKEYKEVSKNTLSQLQIILKNKGLNQDQINAFIAANWKKIKERLKEELINTALQVVEEDKVNNNNSTTKL